MKTQLLCTFTPKNLLSNTLELIIECNDILYNKVYVFQNANELSQLICTYNVEYDLIIILKIFQIQSHFIGKKQRAIHYTQSTHSMRLSEN